MRKLTKVHFVGYISFSMTALPINLQLLLFCHEYHSLGGMPLLQNDGRLEF